jgi:PAS domain S-box-containing protein/putative nucleotidyltransferase with HDIG domain
MTQSARIRILYIEDDPGLARLVQKRLGKVGYTVDIASDGEEGLAKYQAGSYDLLFVDQTLPVYDGLEVIRILGSNGSLPPTVMITGTGDERVAVEAMKLGAGDYIVKDVEGGYLELLPSVVEKMLQQRRVVEEKQQAIASLRESEEKYRSVVERANDGITLIQDGIMKYVNPRLAEMWGGSAQELIGTPFTEYIDPDELPTVLDRYNKRMQGEDVEHIYETVLRRKDGSKAYIELNAGTITYQGKLSDLAFVRNITERKQAEEALRIKDNAIRSSITAIAIAEFGGNLTYVNPEFLRMWGYDDEREVLGKPATNFWHMNKKAGKIIGTMLKEKRVIGELKAKKKDGSLFDIQVSASIVANEHGMPVWMMASCLDITERKQTENALRQSEERYRTLVESIDFGITRMDADHNIVMVNAALSKRVKKLPSMVIGKKCFRVFAKRDAVCPQCPGAQAMATGKSAGAETAGVRDDQSHSQVRIQAFPDFGQDGTACGFIEVVEDISERKQVERALREHKKALQHSFFGTAEALSKVIEDRDPYTSGHSVGVAGLAEAVAHVMGLSEDELIGIYIAGILHDIGKMAVPVEILVKPGRLTDMEMSLIQIHPQAGYEILQGIDFPWPVAQATLQHHERMDGSGYPQGLKGDKIILEARILGVADVVDAMTHHRPYRPAFSLQDAKEEISKGKGRLYDPQVVDACLEVLEGKEAFTSSVYSMTFTSPQLRRGSTKPSALPATTMMRSSGRR